MLTNGISWEQRKVDDIFQVFDRRGQIDLPVLSATQDMGMIERSEANRFIQQNENTLSNYKRVMPGDFVIHLRSFQGGFAHSPMEGLTSPAYTIFAAKNRYEQCDRFWKHFFMTQRFTDSLSMVTYGIRDGRSIDVNEYMNTTHKVPSFNEQQKIGVYFDRLDNLITLHQRKCCRESG